AYVRPVAHASYLFRAGGVNSDSIRVFNLATEMPVGEVALSIPSGDDLNVVLAKPTSWVSGEEKLTWRLGLGRSVTKGFHLGRDKMGGHGRSGVRADWSDDDYFTY
nr:cytochrome c biogenesis CcmF C-terminal-like mitochondrial protein [Tanacetum cinerariifolium]